MTRRLRAGTPPEAPGPAWPPLILLAALLCWQPPSCSCSGSAITTPITYEIYFMELAQPGSRPWSRTWLAETTDTCIAVDGNPPLGSGWGYDIKAVSNGVECCDS